MTEPTKFVVAIDFDDTLVTSNVARTILNKQSGNNFNKALSDYTCGQLTFREYQESAFVQSGLTIGNINKASREIGVIREGFEEIVKLMKEVNGEIIVVSAGLDCYIKPVLTKYGLDSIEIFSVKTKSDHETPIIFQYDNISNLCKGDWAVCKCSVIQRLRDKHKKNVRIMFIGDGSLSDKCASLQCDYVVATGRLSEMLDNMGIDHIKFEDSFSAIIEDIKHVVFNDGVRK